ncbi:hypothetical protein ACNKHT_00895 [Shigella flexneri]
MREGNIQSRRAVVSRLFSVHRAAFREISIGYSRYMARCGAVHNCDVNAIDPKTLNKNRAILRENFLKAGIACFVNDRVER